MGDYAAGRQRTTAELVALAASVSGQQLDELFRAEAPDARRAHLVAAAHT